MALRRGRVTVALQMLPFTAEAAMAKLTLRPSITQAPLPSPTKTLSPPRLLIREASQLKSPCVKRASVRS